jgi:CDP-paratose 2-epimerase
VHEAIQASQEIAGEELAWTYNPSNRVGDHIWWIGDNSKFHEHYPGWDLEYDVQRILTEMYQANVERWTPR